MFQRLKKGQVCADVSILDPEVLLKTIKFYELVAQYLIKQAGADVNM